MKIQKKAEHMHGKSNLLHVIIAVLVIAATLSAFHILRQAFRYDVKNEEAGREFYPVFIDGEYSEEGGPWQTLTRDTKFSVLDYRDITLRGHFDKAIPKGQKLYLKIEHVHIKLSINGKEIYRVDVDKQRGNPSKSRGYFWAEIDSPGIDTSDEVTLDFGNFYWNGYKDQFDELLWNMHTGDNQMLVREAIREDAGVIGVGLVFSVLTLFLLIAALLCAGMRIQGAGRFLWMGLMTLSSVVWFLTLTPAPSLLLFRPVLLSILYVLSIQGIAAFATLFFMSYVSGRRKAILKGCLGLLLAELVKDIALHLAGVIDFYDSINFSMPVDILAAVCIVICLLLELRLFKEQEVKMLLITMIPLVAGGVLELVNGYVQFCVAAICWGIGLAVFIIFEGISTLMWVRLRMESERKMLKLENELTQNRIAIMLSQIQPHFIFNALTTIKYLCDTQPGKASRAVEDFSRYLRGNMTSLTQKAPITFRKELEHLKHYLAIEQLRFDNIQVIYDVKVEDFLIPALTVQPLVENAVRHGVTERENGGTITISTWEDNENWYVTIEDDGVGFTEGEKQEDGKLHVGILNVRNRLADQCSGSLQIQSVPGEGTKVTITVPK